MSSESEVKDGDGNTTHIRVTSDDGSESVLHEYRNDFVADLTGNHKGTPVEVATHHPDGRTDAFEYRDDIVADLTGDHRGEQKNESSGPCYLTTACTLSRGLPDDCLELMTLRGFRDAILLRTPSGRREVAEYYGTAPQVVAAINARKDAASIWNKVYGDVRIAVDFVRRGKYQEAFEHYKKMALRLKEAHC